MLFNLLVYLCIDLSGIQTPSIQNYSIAEWKLANIQRDKLNTGGINVWSTSERIAKMVSKAKIEAKSKAEAEEEARAIVELETE